MISVIIPSRLQRHPAGGQYGLWLERAVESVHQQTVSLANLEIVVGLDPQAELPDLVPGVRAVNAVQPHQAHAVNAAVAASNGEILAFLEDDDWWEPQRLKYGIDCLDRCDVVTCNQREVRVDGRHVRISDYATPSGWLLRRETWDRLGPLDESFLLHLDMEYLGRVKARGLRRIHLVEAGASRRKLEYIAMSSTVLPTSETTPLVVRTVNPEGGMARIAREGEARHRSMQEYKLVCEKYGGVPW